MSEFDKIKAVKNDKGITGPGGGTSHGFQKPKNANKTLFRLAKYLSGNLTLVIIAMLTTIFAALAGVIGAALLKPLINDMTITLGTLISSEIPAAEAKSMVLKGIVETLILMGVIYILGVFCTYLGSRIMIGVAQKTSNKIRKELFEHLQELPIGFFDSHSHGEIMSSFTNDMENVSMALEQSLSQTISSIITVVATFVMMLVLSPVLTIVVVFMSILMFKVVKFVGSKSASYFRQQQKAMGELNGFIEEMMEGQKVVKVFNHEEEACNDFHTKNFNLNAAAIHAQTFAGIMMPIMGNLSYALYALVATIGALMIVNPWNFAVFASFSVGSLGAYLQFTRSFSMPITQISNQTNMLLSALAGAERIFDIMDQPVETDEGKTYLVLAEKTPDGLIEVEGNPFEHFTGILSSKSDERYVLAWHVSETSELVELKGDVKFNNVDFGYIPDQKVLKKVSLYAKPGQKIAFVGSTGAGKTTITNLVNRFYDINNGEITYDGIDVKKIKKDDLRKTMGMVLQDVHLFKGTIKENIRYGKLNATDEEIIRAAKIANAHSFIKRLPDGYDTILSADGINLSQGQRQLLSIARAAVADPPVLILDEATSSIDTRTEKLIEKGMDSLMAGRTTFVIAHRLSTVRNSNAIMVLENGEIIERGAHDDLLDLRGRYYSLYTGIAELA